MNRNAILELEDDFFMFHYRSESERHSYFHSHQGMELLLVHRGEGQLVLQQRAHPLREGHLVILQPFQLHKIDMDTGRAPYVRTVIVLNPYRADELLRPYPHYRRFFRRLWRGELACQQFHVSASHPLLSKLEEIARALASADPRQRREEFALFCLSLLQSIKPIVESGPSLPAKRRETAYVERILEWVERHYADDVLLDRLAAELHLSPSYVSRLFRSETGSSITEYASALRLKEAVRLLVSTSLSVKQIADRVGLRNAPYFCHFFKKSSGLTPTQFRDSYLEPVLEK